MNKRPPNISAQHDQMSQPISILAMSSSVCAGHIGLSAIVPALNALGRAVAALPTVILSNHPGLPHVAGSRVSPAVLHQMLDALEAGGMLADIDTILSGYLPTPEHVTVVETALDRIQQRKPAATYICDPILGDDPKGLYIDEPAAAAIRDRLVPRANILLPNRFELAWLTGRPVTSPADALTAARSLALSEVIVKSVPVSKASIGILHVLADTANLFAVPLLKHVPHGTGDMLSALIAAEWPMENVTFAMRTVIEHSIGEVHLQVVSSAPAWTALGTTRSTTL